MCGDDWQAGAFLFYSVKGDSVSLEDMNETHRHWMSVPVQEDTNINYLELVAIYLALQRFAIQWQDHHVLCCTDNTQAMSAINRGTSVSKESMSVIRQIFWICAHYNIYLSARQIASEVNLVVDCLSRAAIRGHLGIDCLPL